MFPMTITENTLNEITGATDPDGQRVTAISGVKRIWPGSAAAHPGVCCLRSPWPGDGRPSLAGHAAQSFSFRTDSTWLNE